MAWNCASFDCCTEETAGCFIDICSDNARVDSQIAATIILENETFPLIGETVTIAGVPTLLEECNYIEKLVAWARDKQKACAGGNKYYHFISGSILNKGSRAAATQTFDENGGAYRPKMHMYAEAVTTLDLGEQYLPNADVICGIMKRNNTLSILHLFKQGGLLLNSNDDTDVSVTDSNFEVTGNGNEYVRGMFTLTERTKACTPPFYLASNPKTFIKELQKSTTFTFTNFDVTGLTASACGSKGDCIAYDAVASTAFELEPNVDISSCSTFSLVQDCSKSVAVSGIEIDDTTGIITADAGLPVGKYKFTVSVINSCCVRGTKCFSIDVK
jgi:hypothetical protein